MKKLLLVSSFLFVLAGCGQKTQLTTEKPVGEIKKEVPAKKEVVKGEIKKEENQQEEVQEDEVRPAIKSVLKEQSFKNDKYSFSFDYSLDFEPVENYDEQPGNVVYTLQLGEEFEGIMVQVAKSNSLMAPNGMDPISIKDDNVGGKKAKLFEGSDSLVYAVVNGNYEYFITLEDRNTDEKDLKNDFSKIVGSFKFKN